MKNWILGIAFYNLASKKIRKSKIGEMAIYCGTYSWGIKYIRRPTSAKDCGAAFLPSRLVSL